MSKFKVGDTVIFRDAIGFHGVSDDTIYMIKETYGDGCLVGFFDDNGHNVSFHESHLIHATGTDNADPVNNPKHYTDHPSGVECIQITEHMNFNLGNAMKYIWRADLKNDAIEDLQKAAWYVNRELKRRGGAETGE